MKKFLFYYIILHFLLVKAFGYFDTEYPIVDSLSHEWQTAGYEGLELPDPVYLITVDEALDIQDEINNASNYSNNHGNCFVQVEILPGEYTLNSKLTMYSNVILSGNYLFERDGNRDQRTILNFDITGTNHNRENCIEVHGTDSQDITTVGIEDIWINRLDSGSSNYEEGMDQGNNISFEYAENSWVYGVESHEPIKNHIHIGMSNHIEVFGCYLYEAQYHGEGGYGYGVIIEYGSTHCLIENNIFNMCRHAMLVQNAAHYNVYGYNYVHKGKQTTIDNANLPSIVRWLLNTCIPDDFIGDIDCHGESDYVNGLPATDGYRGPFSNLFESNICNAMWVDSFFGQNRKYNTFFRNRTKKYGMSIWDELPDFSVLGDFHSERQTTQITNNNYLKSIMH